MPQDGDLTQSSAGQDVSLEDSSDLFNGDVHVEFLVSAQGYTAIGSYAQFAQEGVLLLHVKGNAQTAEGVVASCGKLVS